MTPQQSGRRYPRAAIDQPGVLLIRSPGARTPPRTVQVSIKSISPEGVGVAVRDPHGPTLVRRTTVTMEFDVAGRHFAIPGQVAWVAGRDQPRGPASMDAGVHFTLAAVPSAMRQEYARWIVELLTRAS